MAETPNYDEFQRVQSDEFDRTLDWDKAPLFEGIFRGTEEKQVKGRTRTFQLFTTYDGEDVTAWGTGVLDGRMKNVAPGSRVKIEYLGKTLVSKAGQPMHNFDVLWAAPAGSED